MKTPEQLADEYVDSCRYLIPGSRTAFLAGYAQGERAGYLRGIEEAAKLIEKLEYVGIGAASIIRQIADTGNEGEKRND